MATAIESMTGVSIKSDFFSDTISLEFFPKNMNSQKNYRVALLYGRNGSGKSSIARGFREYRDSVDPRNVSFSLINGTSSIDPPTTEKSLKIFVFDEEYISSRIKIKDSGLDAIVLFGEQVEIEEQINETNNQIDLKRTEISEHEEKYDQYITASNINSPDHWLNQIRNELRKDNGWAGCGSKIKSQRQNLSVTDAEIDRLGILSATQTQDEALEEFDKRYSQFIDVGSDASILTTEITTISIAKNIVENTKILLEKVVTRPELSAREQKLLELFGVKGITESKTFLLNPTKVVCDKCFQSISDEYRIEILKEIECVLNNEVEEFTMELEKMLAAEIVIDTYNSFCDLPSYNCLRNRLCDYNKAVAAHNNAVQAKINNPFYATGYDDSIDLLAAYNAVNKALTELETDKVNYNHIVNERNTVKNELLDLNDTVAHYKIEAMYNSLQSQRTAKQTAEEHSQQLRADLVELENKMADLDSHRKSFEIASEEINRSLKYIFFCDRHLTLKLGTDQLYHLEVNGNPVTPNRVSCGERNALALCYFFTDILKNMETKAAYSDEILLVIDDPVSSFDIENRIGILSFLRWKLEQVLDGCATSKILVMTHDISVMFDMKEALKEMTSQITNTDSERFQLENKCLSKFEGKDNEYTQLLKKIHQYATSVAIDREADLVIGNVMRRVLEAFTYFSYKEGIKKVSSDKEVLKLLPDEETKLYYRNLMYRLVLNNESHFKENIKGAPETSFFNHLSLADKQRTARDILCFIYCLNKSHILSHLPEAEQDLITWSEAISNINNPE